MINRNPRDKKIILSHTKNMDGWAALRNHGDGRKGEKC